MRKRLHSKSIRGYVSSDQPQTFHLAWKEMLLFRLQSCFACCLTASTFFHLSKCRQISKQRQFRTKDQKALFKNRPDRNDAMCLFSQRHSSNQSKQPKHVVLSGLSSPAFPFLLSWQRPQQRGRPAQDIPRLNPRSAVPLSTMPWALPQPCSPLTPKLFS